MGAFQSANIVTNNNFKLLQKKGCNKRKIEGKYVKFTFYFSLVLD